MENLINYTNGISTHFYTDNGARYAFTIYPEFYPECGDDNEPELEETGRKIVLAITPEHGTVMITMEKRHQSWMTQEESQRIHMALLQRVNEVLLSRIPEKSHMQ